MAINKLAQIPEPQITTILINGFLVDCAMDFIFYYVSNGPRSSATALTQRKVLPVSPSLLSFCSASRATNYTRPTRHIEQALAMFDSTTAIGTISKPRQIIKCGSYFANLPNLFPKNLFSFLFESNEKLIFVSFHCETF